MNSIPTKHISSGQAITHGNAALATLEAAARQITNPHLRQFFNAVVQEPEIHLALTTPFTEDQRIEMGHGYFYATDRYPIQIIQRAVCSSGLWCAHRPLMHDVLLVATIVQSARQLLQDYISPGADLDDVLFTLIRPALHRLDDRNVVAAHLLRGVLGLGNFDEVLDLGALQIRHASVHACQLLHRTAPSINLIRQFKRLRAKNDQSKWPVNKVRRELACGGSDWEKTL